MDLITKKHDEYFTPPYAITPLLPYIPKDAVVWCPFDKAESWFVRLLKMNGNPVVHSHLDDGEDFFQFEPRRYDVIISNPPYSKKTEVLQRLFSLGIPFAMLVGFVGLFESLKRWEMFKKNQFELMIFDKRIAFYLNQDDMKESLNPPFSSVYVCHHLLSKPLVFEKIYK